MFNATFALFTEQPEKSNYVLPYDDAWVIASTTILIAFLIFGVSANSITIAAIHSSPRLKNRYCTMLSSLCVSDILSALISIIFLYRRVWGFVYFAWPEFFCRLYWGVDLWTSFSTALHILSFAILRLIGVGWPTRFQQVTARRMKIWLVSIWLITFVCGFIPHFIFNTVKVIDRSNDESRWASCSLSSFWIATWKVYVLPIYIVFLFGPAVGILGISIAITVLLRKRLDPPGNNYSPSFVRVARHVDDKLSNKQNIASVGGKWSARSSNASLKGSAAETLDHKAYERRLRVLNKKAVLKRRWKQHEQAVLQLFLVVGSFIFGYLPFTAFHLYSGITLNSSSPQINAFDWKFAMVQFILLRFSECLNPVFYNLASKKIRDETTNILKKIFKIDRTSHHMALQQKLNRV